MTKTLSIIFVSVLTCGLIALTVYGVQQDTKEQKRQEKVSWQVKESLANLEFKRSQALIETQSHLLNWHIQHALLRCVPSTRPDRRQGELECIYAGNTIVDPKYRK